MVKLTELDVKNLRKFARGEDVGFINNKSAWLLSIANSIEMTIKELEKIQGILSKIRS